MPTNERVEGETVTRGWGPQGWLGEGVGREGKREWGGKVSVR